MRRSYSVRYYHRYGTIVGVHGLVDWLLFVLSSEGFYNSFQQIVRWVRTDSRMPFVRVSGFCPPGSGIATQALGACNGEAAPGSNSGDPTTGHSVKNGVTNMAAILSTTGVARVEKCPRETDPLTIRPPRRPVRSRSRQHVAGFARTALYPGLYACTVHDRPWRCPSADSRRPMPFSGCPLPRRSRPRFAPSVPVRRLRSSWISVVGGQYHRRPPSS